MAGLLHGVRPSFGEDPETSNTSVTGAGVPHVLFATAPELERGDVLGGRFQIEAVIGSGGSGRVLRAFDRQSRMLVALKILRTEFAEDPIWNERFSRELRVGRTITHPNVCRVFDIGDADGHKFLSMELAPGGCIRSDVPKATTPGAAKPTRAWDDRVVDAQAMVAGVAALHAAGIVHRDIKPENILRMEDGRLVVTDFGLATDPGSGPGNTVMVGTPSYMAPEVVMGDPATLRSDVWGMGVVLHEILFAGRPQWKAAGRGYRRFVLPPVATPAERAVAELCGRCVSDVAELRPASAMELQQALVVALRGTRVLSRRRRRQIGWGAVALAALSTLGLIRDRWTNSARASSGQGAASLSERVLTPTGTPADWSKGATKLASFAGRLHCYSLVDGGRKVRAIWGTPRKAEDIDVKTGERTPSDLLPETYQDGCPVVSPDGKKLLFENASDTGTHVFLAASPQGQNPRQIVRGSSPEWLPNGQEFVFSLDSRHAAMFSVPTGEMTLVTDEGNGPRLLVATAVDALGARLGVLYTTEAVDKFLVVHALPGLSVLARIRVPQSTRRLEFSANGSVLIVVDGPNGVEEIAAVELKGPTLRRLGELPGADITGLFRDHRVILAASGQSRHDLWIEGPEGRSALTSDGASFHGALSARGDLLVQRRLRNGKFVIVLRPFNGAEEQITQGPLDATPTFLADGSRWIYSKVDSGELMECSVEGKTCKRVHADALVPAYPSVDPSGRQLAYLTLMNTPRVRVVTRQGGQARDFGPAADRCAPIWSSTSRLWIAQPPIDSEMTWAEIDLTTGLRTGAIESAKIQQDLECAVPLRLLDRSGTDHNTCVLAVAQETSSVASLADIDGL